MNAHPHPSTAVSHFTCEVAMHNYSYVASRLFKKFLPHSNIFKNIGTFATELSVTKGSSSLVIFIASFNLLELTLI